MPRYTSPQVHGRRRNTGRCSDIGATIMAVQFGIPPLPSATGERTSMVSAVPIANACSGSQPPCMGYQVCKATYLSVSCLASKHEQHPCRWCPGLVYAWLAWPQHPRRAPAGLGPFHSCWAVCRGAGHVRARAHHCVCRAGLCAGWSREGRAGQGGGSAGRGCHLCARAASRHV